MGQRQGLGGTADRQELEGTAKVGVECRTAEQRGVKASDRMVQGSARPRRTG